MENSDSHLVLWAAFVLYGLGLVYAIWRLAMGLTHIRWPKFALILPGLLLHTYYLWERGYVQGRCPVSNLFETFTFISWCLIAIHVVILSFVRINFLTVFYMPIVLSIQLAALVLPVDRQLAPPVGYNSLLGLHASVITLGYASFSLAGALAMMYLIQEGRLRRHRIGTSFMLLPPMMRLDMAQEWLILGGFSLLTFGLLSGFVALQPVLPGGILSDAKFVWSLGVWALYLLLIIGRYFWKLGGRPLAWLSLTGCLFVLSTFWISNALSSFHQF